MPKNVRRYAWLTVVAFLIGLVGTPPVWVASWTPRPVVTQLVVLVVATLSFLAINLPFFWLAVWRGKNWARWVLLLLFVASVPFVFVHWQGMLYPAAGFAVALLSTLVQALALYFLFTGDARPWFRPKIQSQSYLGRSVD